VLAAVIPVFLWCATATAQVASSMAIVPVVAQLRGMENTDWLTELTISNISGFPVAVEARFFKENTANLGLFPLPEKFVLAVGETLTVDNVLSRWFPAVKDTKGFLLIVASHAGGANRAAMITVTARVFNNADPGATYGQAVPSALLHVSLATVRTILPGARWDELRRSNVGILNLSLDPIEVQVTVFDAAGEELSTNVVEVKSLSLVQRGLTQLGVSELSTPGRVEVVIAPGTVNFDPCAVDFENFQPGSLKGVFIAYMSRVDQATGDAEFILGDNDWRDYVDRCGGIPLPGF